MEARKETRGGRRPGAGNKKGLTRVEEKRKQYPLSVPPGVAKAFKEKYGRGWSRRVEELMQADLQS